MKQINGKDTKLPDLRHSSHDTHTGRRRKQQNLNPGTHPTDSHCVHPRPTDLCLGAVILIGDVRYGMHGRLPNKIDMQEEQIRKLEHHAAQLKDSLQAGGLISRSVTSADSSVAAEGGGGGGVAEHSRNRGADGDLP